MRRLSLLITVALPLACPATATADLIWVDPAWSVTATLEQSPPSSTARVSFGDLAADDLTGSFSAYAENPPGTGGPAASVHVTISRIFRLVNPPESVTLRVPVSGSLSVGPAGGSTDSSLGVRFEILGLPQDISISQDYSAPATVSDVLESQSTFMDEGEYIIRGDVDLDAFALSGGPSAGVDVTLGVSLSPTPRSVPEPDGLVLVGCGFVGWLGAPWLRRAALRGAKAGAMLDSGA